MTSLLKKEYNDVSYISGPLLFVNNAADIAYGAIVEIRDGGGRIRGGQVIDVSNEHAIVQIFEDTRGLDLATASVSLVEDVARLGVSKEMIGRRFDGLGRPIEIWRHGRVGQLLPLVGDAPPGPGGIREGRRVDGDGRLVEERRVQLTQVSTRRSGAAIDALVER